MSTQKLRLLIQEFKSQADHPPKNDQYIRSCYQSVVEFSADPNHPLNQILDQVKNHRRETSNQHLVNLFLRVLQYIELWHLDNRGRYPKHLTKMEDWKKEIDLILEKFQPELVDLLSTKDTGTTIYTRYSGTHAAISLLSPRKKVNVADYGCGGAFGIVGLKHQVPFQSITDRTAKNTFTKLISDKLTLNQAFGIDKEIPFADETTKWRIACSMYPSEFDQLEDFIKFNNHIRKLDGVTFVQHDIKKHLTTRYKFDYAVLNTVLYQMPDNQSHIFENVKKSLKPNGVIIVSDFAEKDFTNPKKLDIHGVNWFKTPGGYRTFIASAQTNWGFLEFLKFKDGRCTEVTNGIDFNRCLQLGRKTSQKEVIFNVNPIPSQATT